MASEDFMMGTAQDLHDEARERIQAEDARRGRLAVLYDWRADYVEDLESEDWALLLELAVVDKRVNAFVRSQLNNLAVVAAEIEKLEAQA